MSTILSIVDRPNPAKVAAILKSGQYDHGVIVRETLELVDSGPIITHLCANPDTQQRVREYLKNNLDQSYKLMATRSDPHLQALSYLVNNDKEMRPMILNMIKAELPTSPDGLGVLVRAVANDSLENPAEWVPLVAPYCARNMDYQVWSAAVAVMSKLLPDGQDALMDFVRRALAKDEVQPVIEAFSSVAAAATVHPECGAHVFSTVLSSATTAHFSDADVMLSCLEMLSAICVVKDARLIVQQSFGSNVVGLGVDSNNPHIKVMATAVRVKLLASMVVPNLSAEQAASELDKLSVNFENYVEKGDADLKAEGAAIEGLACTTLLPSVRRRITEPLINKLTQLVKTNEVSWIYGALSILVNVTEYPFKPTKDQQRELELKLRTGPSPFDIQERLLPEDVADPVDAVLNSKIIEWLSQGCSLFTLRSREQVAKLIYNMACQQKQSRRIELATQGGVVVDMYLWVCDPPHQKLDPKYKSIAAAGIAKTLSTIPPQVAFTSRFPAHTIITPLCSQINNDHSLRRNLDTFEAIMSLTNLASMDIDLLRSEIADTAWGYVEGALATDFIQIQRASLELFCNLMTVPACAHHFLAPDEKAKALVSFLGNCLTMDDEAGRSAAAACIAILAEYEDGPTTLGHNPDIVEGIISSMDYTEENDMLLRVLTGLHIMLRVTLRLRDDEVAESLIHYGGIGKLEHLVNVVDPEQKELVTHLLKIIRMLAKFKVEQ
ncbi:Protein unc-45 B [Wickerhamiella sorbophila]|uniref:Protein unc-45 B n=1 Tax=Wickerhamiella sorbophila TaxID=45607 RepID=A0A2T0FDL4_9ASCO|nr:Protein unc-45 B [Wickerhamiella sorbophila]PRT53096.1 Protein unc-45 B [Wickerhamiella sorbophila]